MNKKSKIAPGIDKPEIGQKSQKLLFLKNGTSFSRHNLIAFALLFGLAGGLIIWKSFAAAPVIVSIEAESLVVAATPTPAPSPSPKPTPPPAPSSVTVQGESMLFSSSRAFIRADSSASGSKEMELFRNNTISEKFSLRSSANSLTVTARSTTCYNIFAYMVVNVDGKQVLATYVGSTSLKAYLAKVSLAAGSHALSISFTNDAYTPNSCDRNLMIDKTVITQPVAMFTDSPTALLAATTSSPFALVATDLSASGGKYAYIFANGTVTGQFNTSVKASSMAVTAKSSANCSGTWANMVIAVDGTQLMSQPASATSWQVFSAAASFAAGNHTLNITFNNDSTANNCDINLLVDKVDFLGADASPTPPPPTPTPTPTPPPTSGTVRDVAAGQSILAAIDASAPGDTIRIHAGNYPKLTLDKSFSSQVHVTGESGVVIAGIDLTDVAGYDFSNINSTVSPSTTCCNASAFFVHGHTGNITLRNSTLKGGYITLKFYSGGDAESGWSHDINIHDNDISGGAEDVSHIDGTLNTIIEHNFFHDPVITPGEHQDGIQDQCSDGLQILRNTFSTVSQPIANGPTANSQGIIMTGEANLPNRLMNNTVIANNLMTHWTIGRPLQVLDGVDNVKIVNNTITDGGGDGYSLTLGSGALGSSGVEIWNNIFDQSYLNSGTTAISFFDSNWFRVTARPGMSGTNSFSGDPGFANSTTYSLASGSPAKSKGLTRSGTPTTDIDGTTRPNPPGLGARL